MEKNLYIIVDVSGSMLEGGKHLISRGVVRAIEQYVRLGYGCADLKLVAWSEEMRDVEYIPNNEFPEEMLKCESSANVEALLAFWGQCPNEKILLVTDGFWSVYEVKALKRWTESLQRDSHRIIKIGVDANPQLKGANVFAAEDLFAALDGWLE